MSNNGKNGKERIAKAQATRDRKKGEMRDHLFETVSQTAVARSDWQYGYMLNVTEQSVRLAFGEDPRFVPLMRSGKIAVPDRSTKYPKWSDVLTDEERKKLPRISREEKLPRSLLPVPATGNDVYDADIATLEDNTVEANRRMPARRARAKMDDEAKIFGRLIEQHTEKVDENKGLKDSNRALAARHNEMESQLSRTKRALTAAEQKLARLEGSAPLDEAAD